MADDTFGLFENDDHEPEATEPEADTATLVYEGPFFITSYQIEDEDGGTLVFDRTGTDVPAEDADRLIADAAANGETLTRKAH